MTLREFWAFMRVRRRYHLAPLLLLLRLVAPLIRAPGPLRLILGEREPESPPRIEPSTVARAGGQVRA